MSRKAKIVMLVILALVFVAAAVVAGVVVLHRSNNHSSGASATNSSQTTSPAQREACEIFTLADAKQILNGDVAGGDMEATGTSKDVRVSGCSYKLSSAAALAADTKSASLIAHFPRTSVGIASDQKAFKGPLPPGSTIVGGYGDKAFWDRQLGQLNILKNNIWYVLTYGTAAPADRSLQQTKQLADILAPKL